MQMADGRRRISVKKEVALSAPPAFPRNDVKGRKQRHCERPQGARQSQVLLNALGAILKTTGTSGVPISLFIRQALLAQLGAILILTTLTASALAVPEPRHIDTRNVIQKEEAIEMPFNESEAERENGGKMKEEAAEQGKVDQEEAGEPRFNERGEERVAPESKSENEAEVREEAAEHENEEVEEGEEEHQPAWMFPGWQTIFAVLAVAYYALALTVLPRIMAKEVHH